MKIAVMQPYFFPYVGYFEMIQSVEKLFLDNVQYIKQGWIKSQSHSPQMKKAGNG